MPVAANLNMLWARALAEELARSGVRHACVCPGNRSGPFAFALAAQQGVKVWSHVDERSAGFFALGLARAARGPVAVLCTSGTAAANLHPAVLEASLGRVPLVVLSADRPHDLREVGANQVVRQPGLYGDHVRWHAEAPEPALQDRALRYVRTLACRAVAEARGPPAGPVHVNLPVAKPLEPTPRDDGLDAFAQRHALAAQGHADGRPFVAVPPVEPRPPGEPMLRALAERVAAEPRGLIVAGPLDDPRLPPRLAELAKATGYPLLADPLSQARFGEAWQAATGAYDAILQSAPAREALRPGLALRFGAAPTSDALLQWLEEQSVPQVVLDEAPWREPALSPGARVVADPAATCAALLPLLPGGRDAAWASRWRALDDACWASQERSLQRGFSEAAALALALDAAPDGATLFVSSSLPVRDLDRFGKPRRKPLRVLGNRGASGIDGVTSTALGAAAGGAGPVLLLTGDLAFYHDMAGLLAAKRLGARATIVVLNNHGGRIFDGLPAARFDPPYEELFATPTGLDFAHAAALFGLGFARAEDAKSFREELARALEAPGTSVVEARVDPAAARAWRAAARDEAVRAVEGRLRA
jgi:2-succinyl-5-enolpyruvyl-6-hydroxy-3-cyclohexene-1-carboxylate synthase